MSSARRCFRIAKRSVLGAATKDDSDRIDSIWTAVNNNEFYELAGYVAAYTGVRLQGYRRSEDPDAFNAVQRTLGGLDRAMELMNNSDVLRRVADAIVEAATPDEDLDFNAAWDQLIAEAQGDNGLASLLRVLKRQFVSFETQLGDAHDEISRLVVYRVPDEEENRLASEVADGPDVIRDVAVLISVTREGVDNDKRAAALADLAKTLSDADFIVQQLVDEPRSAIESSLQSGFASVPPGSRLLVFWSGDAEVAGDSVHLMLADSNPNQSSTMLAGNTLGRLISRAEYSRLLMMLDGRQTGRLVSEIGNVLADGDRAGSTSSTSQPPGIVIGQRSEPTNQRGLVGPLLSILKSSNVDTPWTSADELIDGVDLLAALGSATTEGAAVNRELSLESAQWGDTRYLLKNPGWAEARQASADEPETPTEPETLAPVSSSDAGSRSSPLPDAATRTDRLRRNYLARTIADQMVAVRRDMQAGATEETAFGLMLDGPWGSGKSTLMKLLEDDLAKRKPAEADWLPIRFDAWRESQVGPPWWSLIVELRRAITPTMSKTKRCELWFRSRWRLIGTPFAVMVGLLGLLIVGVVIWLSVTNVRLDLRKSEAVIGLVASTIALAATVVAIAAAVTRGLSLTSSGRAERLEHASADPTKHMVGQLDLLLESAPLTPLLMIDDLDRCASEYVVELLDAIQTLIRAPSREVSGDRQPFFFIVAADGRWIRTAYEHAHSNFIETISEPARHLGYLFTEKLFQVSVHVPNLSDRQRKTFLRSRLLLSDREPELNEDGQAQLRDLKRQISQAKTREEIVRVMQSAAPDVLEHLYDTAIERQHEIETPEELNYILADYHSDLPANPRAITRFVMAFAVTSAARSAETLLLSNDPLARWVLVSTRWPALADFLRTSPESIAAGGPELPADLRTIPDLDEAARILVDGDRPFSVALLRRCAGSPMSE